jgi:hypothetical protein
MQKKPVAWGKLVVMVILWTPIIMAYRSCRNYQPPAPEPVRVAPWKGQAAWVAMLEKVLDAPASVPVYGKVKDGDVDLITYDFAKLMPHGTATMTRTRGKPAAWRWQVSGTTVQVDDLVQKSDLEHLVTFQGGTEWYRIRSGRFADHMLAIQRPAKSDPMVTIEPMAYSETDVTDGIRPWLCSNGRVPGVQKTSTFEATCERLVREQLRAPSTAEFQQFRDDPSSYSANCDMEIKSWVEAKNAFGVPLRNPFICRFNAKTGVVTAQFLR